MPLLRTAEQEQESNRPTPRRPFAERIFKKVSETHNFEPLSAESLQNLAEANQLLAKEALIIYVNHTSTSDAAVAITLALSHLTNARHFMAPAGMKHYDLTRDPMNAILLRSLRLLNIQVMPVVQHNDLENYPPKKKERMIQQLKKKAQRFLNKPRSIYGITPEGTRNKKTGELLEGRPGLGKLEKHAPQTIKYLPIAIIYEKYSDKPQIVVGKPETLGSVTNNLEVTLPEEENARAKKITDILMYKLSLLMPQNLRGQYSDYNP